MTPTNDKFLVRLLSNVSHIQIFFLVWAAIVGGFVLMMTRYYKKYTRRNFREDGLRPSVRVDLRRLESTSKGKEAQRRDNTPTKR